MSSSESEGNKVKCEICQEEMWDESSACMYCELCEEHYCQTCCYKAEEDFKKKGLRPILVEFDDYDDWVCPWCEYDQ